jgi:hypothetical protein
MVLKALILITDQNFTNLPDAWILHGEEIQAQDLIQSMGITAVN